MTLSKEHILTALRAWINQRPGLEYGNYGDPVSYRAELRQITKDRAHALQLLQAVELRDSITAENLIAAFPRAYSGRLSIEEATNKKGEKAAKLDYCTGQYWPTEYRKAACAVLASALWEQARNDMPAPTGKGYEVDDDGKERYAFDLYNGKRAGDYLRNKFRQQFGRGIQSRWFD